MLFTKQMSHEDRIFCENIETTSQERQGKAWAQMDSDPHHTAKYDANMKNKKINVFEWPHVAYE